MTLGWCVQLISHPAHSPGAITAVDAYVTRAPDGLMLSYTLTGDINALVLPAKTEPAAPTTSGKRPASNCSSRGDGAAYREYNFSPSGDWAAYAFDSYREGRREIPADDRHRHRWRRGIPQPHGHVSSPISPMSPASR